MRSKKVTISVPHKLYELAEKFAKHAGYAKTNDLFIWSAFYAIAMGSRHIVTAPIAGASPNIQDMYIEELRNAVERGENTKSFFAELFSKVVEEFKIDAPVDVVRAMVSEVARTRKGADKGKEGER
jgi:hypothetical protein